MEKGDAIISKECHQVTEIWASSSHEDSSSKNQDGGRTTEVTGSDSPPLDLGKQRPVQNVDTSPQFNEALQKSLCNSGSNEVAEACQAVLDAKTALESRSCNLNKEVREIVCEKLHHLQELVLFLAESRTNLKEQMNRERLNFAKELEQQSTSHTQSMEEDLNESNLELLVTSAQKSTNDKLDMLCRQNEASRLIMVHDLAEPLDTVRKEVEYLRREMVKTQQPSVLVERLAEEVRVLQQPFRAPGLQQQRGREGGQTLIKSKEQARPVQRVPPLQTQQQVVRNVRVGGPSEQASEPQSAKMLIFLQNGEQRLITFTLPKESCTLQEVLEQVNVPFHEDTHIQCMQNTSSEIDYFVSVGMATRLEDMLDNHPMLLGDVSSRSFPNVMSQPQSSGLSTPEESQRPEIGKRNIPSN